METYIEKKRKIEKTVWQTYDFDALQQARQELPDLSCWWMYTCPAWAISKQQKLYSKMLWLKNPTLYVAEMRDYPIFTPEGRFLNEKEYVGKNAKILFQKGHDLLLH